MILYLGSHYRCPYLAVLGELLIRFHVYIEFSYPYLIMFVYNDQFQYDKPMVLHTS